MSDQCNHEALRKECWRVIYLDWDAKSFGGLVVLAARMVGKAVMCADCMQRIAITDEWLHGIRYRHELVNNEIIGSNETRKEVQGGEAKNEAETEDGSS